MAVLRECGSRCLMLAQCVANRSRARSRKLAAARAFRRLDPRSRTVALSPRTHGPSPVQDRHAHRRRRHDRPGRRLARRQGFAAHRRDRQPSTSSTRRSACCSPRALPDADRRLPHRRPARSVRPRRRAVDSRLPRGDRRARRCGSRTPSSASTPTCAPLKEFILPGGTRAAALAHVARTVCRRAERTLVTLAAHRTRSASPRARYLNRLSDLLFVLARALNRAGGTPGRALAQGSRRRAA